ncbi:MAG: GntR family transcriptional regulator [Sulfobacillus thermosulfidooxidans]|uniref:GntR family transcriptional regulator n=1 Tax=Sulfobacillus thermotolerans TaxID=338644 RepID=A0ABN5H1S8_9FIRM|nr:GntR family transcriptional regulator [Sulfobacillus thermotolerans]PSR36281.1 MAG: GntR family transcriptional regulator [Sulfobacillus thermosulfidooxidans]
MQPNRLPLPRQVEARIKERIISGECRAGEQLPSEEELAHEYGVSRATVREAVSSLALQGYLIKRRGVGTFVGQPDAISGGLESLISITEWIRQSGREPGTTFVEIDRRPPTAHERELFAPWKTEEVAEIHRVRTASQIPVLYCIDVIPGEFAPTKGSELDESLLTFLEKRWGQVIIFAQTEIDVVTASKPMADHLKVPRATPLLCLRQAHYNQHSTVLLWSQDHFLPGHFRFDVRRHRQ